MTRAPIALFVYNRPWHTQRTVEALRANALAAESALYVFSDAARNAAAQQAVNEVRSYLRKIEGFREITIVERETNLGLARSIIDGVTQLCDTYGRVVVLEDDLVTSPHFLQFMNDGLDAYAQDERVASIHGYVYPVRASLPETFFLRGTDCWGWATWKRAWNVFEPNGAKLLDALERAGLTRRFDFDGAYPYTRMLRNQIKGKNNSWAIRWHASVFLRNMLTLYPGRSLVENIGTDSSGTHCSTSDAFSGTTADSPVMVGAVPVGENEFVRQQFIRFFRAAHPWLPIRALRKLAHLVRQMK